MKVGELLEKTYKGQMIKLVLIDEKLDEYKIIEFENDERDYRYLMNKQLFNKKIYLLAAEFDFLRIEVLHWIKRKY